ncbi:MAG: glycosyl hydrolase 115 family protein, partial [Spirochaetaceae bacterium]
MLITDRLSFVYEPDEFSGVLKIARNVAQDVERVFGFTPTIVQHEPGTTPVIVFGTLGKNRAIESLERSGTIKLSDIRGKREVYGFFVLEDRIVIAGSDKRGAIYGLFHFSELLGVSPLVNWADVRPRRRTYFEFTHSDSIISREPSVKFRGFFINDEWPAFGNWARHNFGGCNADMYEQIFDLLLRMKGNYLWPAMWASRFSDDGPGLASAERADELGVVMGSSHHEPCCRAGEEYRHLRGPDSNYGDAWSFLQNRSGITKFWEDGLIRNGGFENVITVGMRGEADTKILSQDATLQDNIDLLRDVITTQNSLIRKHVNSDLKQVPRMLALYKEVEDYFYGDAHTTGLINDPELDGVTLMFCDDNHGNVRTLPDEHMRSHAGGFGMYYHLDYHGSPYSYEWLNTSYLPKIKEQMCMAYEFGVRDIWIVNVGDIMTNEFPLQYFLDLAYDYPTYSRDAATTAAYTTRWVQNLFPGLSAGNWERIEEILSGYTKLTHRRRTECLMPDTYHPTHFSEADSTLADAERIIAGAETLKQEIPEDMYPSFFTQVYFPACGTMNVLRMQLLSGKNRWLAGIGAREANTIADRIRACYAYDTHLVTECDTVAGGKWYAMGWSEHFGFTHWCEGENRYPVYQYVEPSRKRRLTAWVDGTSETTTGQEWTRKNLLVTAFRRPDIESATIHLAECSREPVEFHVAVVRSYDTPWISTTVETHDDRTMHAVILTIDREKLSAEHETTASIQIVYDEGFGGRCSIEVDVDARVPNLNYDAHTYIQTEDYISIEAEHFARKRDGT